MRGQHSSQLAVLHLALLALFGITTTRVHADVQLDRQRTGTWLTDIPFYRSGQGTNVVPVQVGSTGTRVNLTVTTNVDFVVVATDACVDCTVGTEQYVPEDSNTFELDRSTTYTVVLPQLPDDTLTFTARLGKDRLLDARQDPTRQYPIAAADSIRFGGVTQGGEGLDGTLPNGIAGFYGLGINTRPVNSLIPYMSVDNQYLPAGGSTSFSLGMDVFPYDRRSGARAGTLHWGAAPEGAWVGEFNWYETNQSVAGSWGLGLGNIRMGGNVIDASGLYASLDPGYDGIYVPTRIAEQLLGGITGVSRDPDDPRRWNIPCNYIQSLSITLAGTTYSTSPQQLVEPRDTQGFRCMSQVQAWANGSVPDIAGEIRLGTSFMSNVYSVFYWSANERYVGLAGKPNSVNNENLVKQDRGIRNSELAGILIGTLLAVLLILLGICYGRNANTWQSIFQRHVRDVNRVQYNAVVRATTIPPMMAMAPTMGPMGPMMPGAMGPMGMGMGMGMGVNPAMMGGMTPGMGPMGPMGPMGRMGPMQGNMGMLGQMNGMHGTGMLQQQQPPAYQAPMPLSQAQNQHNQLQQQQPLLGAGPHGGEDPDEKIAKETHDRPAFLGLSHFRRSRRAGREEPPMTPPKPRGYIASAAQAGVAGEVYDEKERRGHGRNAIKVPDTDMRMSPPPTTERGGARLGTAARGERAPRAGHGRSRSRVPEEVEGDIGVVSGHRRTSRSGMAPEARNGGAREGRRARAVSGAGQGYAAAVYDNEEKGYHDPYSQTQHQAEEELYDPYQPPHQYQHQPAPQHHHHHQQQQQQSQPQQPYALDPALRGTYHRPTDSQFEHAPPLSATARSIWKFGKSKPSSVARGYSTIPKRLQSRYEIGPVAKGTGSGSTQTPTPEGLKGEVARLREIQEANIRAQQPQQRRSVAVPAQNQTMRLVDDGMSQVRDANTGDTREGWEAVERNREREGLGHQGQWR